MRGSLHAQVMLDDYKIQQARLDSGLLPLKLNNTNTLEQSMDMT